MAYILEPLPYAYDALEPYIDAQTMELHHDKHHQAYIDKVNAALEPYPHLHSKTIEWVLKNLDAVPEDIKTTVRNNGGGHFNHDFFWKLMKPKSQGIPHGLLAHVINDTFGSLEKFKQNFNQAAGGRFGSGWAWLSLNKSGILEITSTANQDSPLLQDMVPIVGLDVWEHAYYLLYNNRRPDYIDAWWHVINWEQAEANYQKALQTL